MRILNCFRDKHKMQNGKEKQWLLIALQLGL